MASADKSIKDAVTNNLPHELYPSLSEKRIILGSYKENIIKLGKSKMGNFIEDANCTDLVMLGIIHRSIKINEGFISLIDKWNLLCAAPMIRLQIDTLLRLSYLSTLEDREDISRKLLSGERINNIEGKDGKKLNDYNLKKYATGTFPWINEIYTNTSKFIHFSEKHILTSIIKINEDDHTVYFAIGSESKNAKEEDLVSYYDVMIRINKGICQLINSIYIKK